MTLYGVTDDHTLLGVRWEKVYMQRRTVVDF